MKKFFLIVLLILLFMPRVEAYQLAPQKISQSSFSKTDLSVFKNKILFSENNDANNYLKLYDADTNLTKLIKSSTVPFEYIGFNNLYAVWSQRSTTFVQKGTFWEIKAYNMQNGKTVNISIAKKFNKYPLLSGKNVVYYESSFDGSYPRLIKVNIPTGKRTVLLTDMHIFHPTISGNLMLFTSNSSNYFYVLNIDTGKIVSKIDCGSQMNDVAFTDTGIIWSSSNQEFSTSSELYEYFFYSGKIKTVIKGLSWGKGHNFISPIRAGSYVFYLSGDDANGLDLWMHDLKLDVQLSLAKNIIKYDSSPRLVAYIADKNIFSYKVNSKETKTTSINTVKNSNLETNYPDLNKHWAKEIILKLKTLNIMSGNTDRSGKLLFRPRENISRAEFSTMLCLALKIHGASGEKLFFTDVSKHWALPFINALHKAGVIKGNTKNTFSPNSSITRAEAAIMISRAKKWPQKNHVSKSFKDIPQNYWAYKAITQLRYYNVINGNADNLFQPSARLTRAESAVMIYNLLKNK